jgi:tripartite-type tricarboxylate transporter receptor subunit TctC
MRLELCESGPLPGKYEPLNLLDYIRRLKTTRAARKVLPYRGGGPALQDLVAGHVDSYFGNPAEIVGQTGGRIRVLATSGATRLKSLPEVQTLSESYPGLSLVTWNGLVYLDGTPQEMIQRSAGRSSVARRMRST